MNQTLVRDKYSAIWVSHSSINDYMRCPRAYFLKNVYRDPNTNHKISIMQPGLALGQIVHDVLDEISFLPISERLSVPLSERFDKKWSRISGQKGGFNNLDQELEFKSRGQKMIQRIMDNPGPISRKAIKLRSELPYYWLSKEENIILCGKLDWLEYDETNDRVWIVDFKTGKFDEDKDSLQLPIYYLLTTNVQNREIAGAKYWYLDRDNEPINVELPDIKQSEKNILDIAKRIALARKLERFQCNYKEGCSHCRPFELVISGRAKRISTDNYNQDVYVFIESQLSTSYLK